MPTIKSGAFLQQCFAAHPLSLNFKIVILPDRVVLTCANCHMRHRMTVRSLTIRVAEVGGPERDAIEYLTQCGTAHGAELRVSGMDVVTDTAKIRCGECRRTYHLDVATFETYQKES